MVRSSTAFTLEEQSESINITSIVSTIDELERVAAAYGEAPLRVAGYAEAHLRKSLKQSHVFHRTILDKAIAALLAIAGVLAIINSSDIESIKSGLFAGQILVVPWCFLVSAFLMVDPKYGTWLRSFAAFWSSVLLSALGTAFSLWTNADQVADAEMYKKALQVLLYAFFAYIFIAIGVYRISENSEKMKNLQEEIEGKLNILQSAMLFTELSRCQKSSIETLASSSELEKSQVKNDPQQMKKRRSLIAMLTRILQVVPESEN